MHHHRPAATRALHPDGLPDRLADAAQPSARGRTRPTVRQVSPPAAGEQLNSTQRELVKASLIARPGPAKPAHRRWAEPGS